MAILLIRLGRSIHGELPQLVREYANDCVSFDRSTFPHSNKENNTVFDYQEHTPPVTADSLGADWSVDGHDYRSDFNWIIEMGFDWIITDTADDWHERLKRQGLRNLSHFLASGEPLIDPDDKAGYYRRSHG